MVRTQKITPIESEPASPINTLAGEKLKKMNPTLFQIIHLQKSNWNITHLKKNNR